MSLNNVGLGFLFTAKDLASGVMGDVKKHLLDVEGVSKETAKSIGESFATFGTGLAIMGTGLGVVAGLNEAIESADDFQKAVSLVATRVSEAEFPMAEITRLTNDLSAQFGLMPMDEAKAMYEAVAAGAHNAATATGLMTAANQLAVGTHGDLNASLASVAQTAKVFGIDLQHSAVIADSLFAASKHVIGGVNEMNAMLEHLGPTAASAGLSMNELLAVIAEMNAAGIQGRPALGGLKAVLDALISPSKDAAAEASRLGIAWDSATLQAQGLPAVLSEIASTGKMNSTTLEKLFGNTEAATVAMALMKNGGADLNGMMAELAHSTGAAAAAADLMIQPDERFRALNKQIVNLIGDALLPARDAFLDFLNAIMKAFTNLNPGIIKFVTYIVAGGAMLAVLVGGSVAAAAAFTLLQAGAAAAGISIAELGAAIWAALWPVLPYVAIAALAIAMFKVAFDNNFGGIADVAREVYADVSLVFESLAELFSGGGFTEDTWQKLEAHSGIRNFVLGVYGWVSRLENLFSGIGKGFEGALGMFAPMFGVIGRAIDSLLDAFSNLAGPQGADGAARAFDAFGTVGEMIGVILGGLSPLIATAINLIIMAFHFMVSSAVGAFGFVRSLFSGLIDMFLGLGELLTGIVHGNLGQVWHGFKMMAFGAIDGVIGMLLSLVGVFAGVIDSIAGLFGKKLNLQGDLTGFRDSMHDQMAKDFGVDKATGLRAENRSEATPGLASFASPPPPDSPLASFGTPAMSLAGAPGIAAAGGTPAGGGLDFGAMAAHLDQISKNTSEGGPPINVTVMLDSEVVGKATSKAKKSNDTRSFTPAPMPE